MVTACDRIPMREEPTELARDGSAVHRLARRANPLILLDDGMSYAAVARVGEHQDPWGVWRRPAGEALI